MSEERPRWERMAADGVWTPDDGWQFTIFIAGEIVERRSGYKTEYAAETGMEAAWQRTEKRLKATPAS